METSDRQSLEPIIEVSESKIKSNQQQQNNFWVVFSSTFITIFLAEMGDKTQLVTLLMSAESQAPWVVFAGAALALIATSLIGVSIGYWLSKKLTPETLDLSVAILLLIITAWLISDVLTI
ncbi:MAG: TMEM165/GDT1 family protein [Pleurocapsa sp. MO_192.B19]|nr:TMEM165/GDT1 family protein [Pleurocapsa sp. MO_192.B19]